MLPRTFIAGIVIVGTVLASGAFAQLTSFPKPSYFRETFSRSTAKVELQDPVHLKDFVAGDRLELSLKNFLVLVMANNTDIQIQMLSLDIPKDAITRAFSTWDPLARASFSANRTVLPSTSTLDGLTATTSTLSSLSQPAQFSYSQTLPTGATYGVTYSAGKTSTASMNALYNPSLSSNLAFTASQPLIKNRGSYVNRLGLMTARSRYRQSEYNLRAQLLILVNAAENAYWDVVSARETLKVAEGAREVSAAFLKLSEKQLDLGALSPLDIYNPQQQLANADLVVSQARFALAQTENALRKQIAIDLDPALRKLPIVLTETVDFMTASTDVDAEQAVARALANRPDLKSAVQNLDIDELAIQSARNGLLPNLSLSFNYSAQGIGGNFLPTSSPGGLTDAVSQMFSFGYPGYGFGINLTLPIKSHSASADMADAVSNRKRDALNVRTTAQGVRLDILNAVVSLQGSVEQLKLAKLARDFAQKNLDAENKKYELGTDINQNVILAQNALVQAESNVVVNQIGLRRNLLTVLTKTGELLDDRGIVVQ
jgi:outer membrane protein TolC